MAVSLALGMALLATLCAVTTLRRSAAGGAIARVLAVVLWIGMLLNLAVVLAVSLGWPGLGVPSWLLVALSLGVVALVMIDAATLRPRLARVRTMAGAAGSNGAGAFGRIEVREGFHLVHRGIGALLMIPCLLGAAGLASANSRGPGVVASADVSHHGQMLSLYAFILLVGLPYLVASGVMAIRHLRRVRQGEAQWRASSVMDAGGMTGMVALMCLP